MSKRTVKIISILLTISLIAYTGYDSLVYNTADGTLKGYLDIYLNSVQKYIYNGMIYFLPLLYSTGLQFMKPQYLTRIRNKATVIVTKHIFLNSVLTGIYVMGIYYVTGLFLGYSIQFDREIIGILIRLILFYLQCSSIYYAVYVISGRPVLSLMSILFFNMVFLIVVLALDFLKNNTMPLFIIFESVTAVFFFLLFYVVCKRREYIKC